jgi:large subunit ribosomal protein L18
MKKIIKNTTQRRKIRIRKKLMDNRGLPRLSVHRSNKHLWAQLIDDKKGHTLFSLSTKNQPLEKKQKLTKTQQASHLGTLSGQAILKLKVTNIRFDKGAYRYHGRVKAFAEAARKTGLKF